MYYLDLTKCALFTPYRSSSIETAHLCQILEQSDNYSWRYCISKNWGIQKVLSRMQCGCLSSHWQFVACTFRIWCFIPVMVSNLKEIGQLFMKILHFEDLADTESVVTNSGVLVLWECQVSIATYLRGYLPSYKVVLQCNGNWQCYATLK